MKVLEAKPIVELVNGTLTCNSKRIPPRSNGSILKVSFFQGCGFFVFLIEGLMLIMEL
jgi:hypothetical protein